MNKTDILMFSDIHFGKRQNSHVFNESAIEVVRQYIEECKKLKIKNGVFGGDWHDSRIVLNVSTLSYSIDAFTLLNEYFESTGGKLYVLIGNHDLYYRYRRSVNSLGFLEHFDNIILIDEPQEIEIAGTKVMFIPWLCPEDNIVKIVNSTTAKICIGHFELASFKWGIHNDHLTEGLHVNKVKKFKLVVSGHYHHHQAKKNVVYIGSPMQMDFGDCESSRGFLKLNLRSSAWSFIANTFSPQYHKIKLTEVLSNLTIIKNNHIKILEDVELQFESHSKLQKVLLSKEPLSLVSETFRQTSEEEEVSQDISKLERVEDLLIGLIEQHAHVDRKESLLSLLRSHL